MSVNQSIAAVSDRRHKAKRILITVLATIGAGTIISYGALRVLPHAFPPDVPIVMASMPSPNGEHRALLLNVNGGGAISPYCIDFVSVVPSNVSESAALDRKYNVWTGGCSAIPDASSLKWLSDNRLEIAFHITTAAEGVAALTMTNHDITNAVRLEYKQP